MPLSSRSYANRYTPSNRFPEGVKWLLIVNIAIFALYHIVTPLKEPLTQLALIPSQVVGQFKVWQIVTYMFLHVGIMSAVWNFLSLWLFGAELERTWGTVRFLRFYFICGIASGVAAVLLGYALSVPTMPVVSSAGAIYGLLAAYAIVFPDATLLFGLVFPMKSKYFVLIVAAIDFLMGERALLTGLLAGYLLLRGNRLHGQIRESLAAGYKDWKLKRARKKFEVYLKRRDDSKSGPWVN